MNDSVDETFKQIKQQLLALGYKGPESQLVPGSRKNRHTIQRQLCNVMQRAKLDLDQIAQAMESKHANVRGSFRIARVGEERQHASRLSIRGGFTLGQLFGVIHDQLRNRPSVTPRVTNSDTAITA